MPEVDGRFALDTALALENVGGSSDLKFVEPGDTLLSCCMELEKGLAIPFDAEIRDSGSLSDRDTGAAQENVGGRSDLKFVELGDTLLYCNPAVELEKGFTLLLDAKIRDAGGASDRDTGAAQENVDGRSDLKLAEPGHTFPSYCIPAVELETGLVMLFVANTRDAVAAHEDVSG
eukprot:CAMPEP_0194486518 /NCGR_PEP_ID=MMETSP0253-20130528/7133_1 /TAXON_ID=2966 /ORGANISM="Noctiluca scintillans" /LENGTH=174 /DNA_ID=CAMNT_0039326613 /DNA_START=961 /DNA_END=1485 /DNA_ORIENTATION=-